MPSRFCHRHRRVGLAASALFFSLAAGVAAAQGPMPVHMGHRGPAHFEAVIAQLKGQLNLDTSQQVLWDNAIATTKAAHEQGRALREKVRAAAQSELAKPEPDLAAMATIVDDALGQGHALHKEARDQWLKLYATFSPAQKGVVRDALQERFKRFERFHERHGRG